MQNFQGQGAQSPDPQEGPPPLRISGYAPAFKSSLQPPESQPESNSGRSFVQTINLRSFPLGHATAMYIINVQKQHIR